MTKKCGKTGQRFGEIYDSQVYAPQEFYSVVKDKDKGIGKKDLEEMLFFIYRAEKNNLHQTTDYTDYSWGN